jgi:tRNA pseudouridine32 synthase/23S rRNA pseudouridine746 synthase
MSTPPQQPGEYYNPPPDTGLAIIHVDNDLLVLDKPSGLLSVPGKGDHLTDCLMARAKAEYPQALLVHRLDRDTSGLIIFAMNSQAQRHLGLQFERRKLSKTYEALVQGVVEEEAGIIDLPITLDWPNRPLQKICHETGRPAQTRWRVLSRDEASTRMRLDPETGRSHQLRLHMRELGHPILGDTLYGDAATAPRLMLHARKLTLHHPTGGQITQFEARVPF